MRLPGLLRPAHCVGRGDRFLVRGAHHSFSSDVRAEAYLTAFVIGGVYHFHRASSTDSHSNLVAGSLFAAAAVMT
jgi:hypothetical protein